MQSVIANVQANVQGAELSCFQPGALGALHRAEIWAQWDQWCTLGMLGGGANLEPLPRSSSPAGSGSAAA